MRRVLLSIVVAAISAHGAGAAPQASPDLDRVVAEAEALNAKGAYREVVALIGPLEQDPSLPPRPRARLLSQLGLAQTSTGQHDAALRSADEAERLARPLDDADLLAQVELLRGAVTRVQSGPLVARGHYESAVRWAEQAKKPRLLAAGYTGLGNVAQLMSDWSRVLYYAERAWEANPGADPLSRHRYAISRGIAFYEIQESDAAERSFREALGIAENAGNRHGVSLALGELGQVYFRLGETTKALDHFDRAIAMARQIGVPDLEVTWLLNSGNVFRDGGMFPEALRRYRLGLSIERKSGQMRSLPVLLKNIGQTLALAGHAQEAKPFLLEALEQADSQSALNIRWQARMELGALYSQADPTRADRYFVESLEALEGHHDGLLLETFRAGALSRSLTTYDPYDLYVSFLLDRGEDRKAFLVAERARARAFLDTLRSTREQIAAAVSPAFVSAERDLLRRISSAQASLRTGQLDVPKRQAIAASIQKDEEALTALRLKLANERPSVAAARYPRLPAIEEMQRSLLGADEAVALFFVGRKASALWVVSRDRLEVARLPTRAELEPTVREYLDTFQSRVDQQESAGRVWNALGLDRLAALADGHRLVIVPHGILHYVPFEALRDPTGRYLVERFAISYAPSASSFSYLRSQPRVADARTVITVGNPITSEGASATAVERSLPVERVDLLKPLPYAARELRDIAALFGRRGRVLERDLATEPALDTPAVQQAAVVHFATHGLIDEERPERSALALTARPPDSDGVLQMREVYGLRLRAALVTLSACQTALGKDVTGEGIVGLTRAFFYAGANSVMASLWNINDASTARFMTMFYEGLARGESIDRAARDAKLRFLRGDDSALRHPYYWAPFVVSGNAAVSLPPAGILDGGRTVTAAALAAAALAVAGYFIARRRRSRKAAAPIG